MKKNIIKILLPMMAIGMLAGCSSENDKKVAAAAFDTHSIVYRNGEDGGNWASQKRATNIKNGEYLVFYPHQLIGAKEYKVDVSFEFDAETKDLWEEGIIDYPDPEDRVKLTPTFYDDGRAYEATMTLTAKYKSATAKCEYKFKIKSDEVHECTIADLDTVGTPTSIDQNNYVRVKGKITYLYSTPATNGFLLSDGTHSTMVYKAGNLLKNSMTVGTYVKVTGLYTRYNGGLSEISPVTDIKVCTSAEQAQVAAPVTFESTLNDWQNIVTMKANSARLVNLHNLKVTQDFLDKKPSSSAYVNATLYAVDPDNSERLVEITVKYNKYIASSEITAITNKLNLLAVDDMIDVNGATVDFLNGRPVLSILTGASISAVA